jgi:hypothetical protein
MDAPFSCLSNGLGTDLMNFEYRFNKSATALLEQHKQSVDRLLQELLRSASKKHELGDANTLKKIKAICVLQLNVGMHVLSKAALDIIEHQEKNIVGDNFWVCVSHKIQTLYTMMNEQKLKALKASQGANVNQRLIEVASLDQEYKQYRNEAKHQFDGALQALVEKRDKQRKSAAMKRVYKNLFYVSVVLLLCVVGWVLLVGL